MPTSSRTTSLRYWVPAPSSKTVVVQTVSSEHETDELLTIAAEQPFVAGVVGWVDLTARDLT